MQITICKPDGVDIELIKKAKINTRLSNIAEDLRLRLFDIDKSKHQSIINEIIYALKEARNIKEE